MCNCCVYTHQAVVAFVTFSTDLMSRCNFEFFEFVAEIKNNIVINFFSKILSCLLKKNYNQNLNF